MTSDRVTELGGTEQGVLLCKVLVHIDPKTGNATCDFLVNEDRTSRLAK